MSTKAANEILESLRDRYRSIRDCANSTGIDRYVLVRGLERGDPVITAKAAAFLAKVLEGEIAEAKKMAEALDRLEKLQKEVAI